VRYWRPCWSLLGRQVRQLLDESSVPSRPSAEDVGGGGEEE